ncbi:hypothetical protein [Pseudomonas sp. Xaverov 83]|uniref:hypothetical protein n=1 Tax=Pseudomonas sp. Xaverov 83 TaxID=2666087 RepID=UPI001C5B7D7F|nr:hypothetical protein [Pseudomonas sp. Xaverov 83]
MDDEGDFKKARGFLLTYSALVLALWYFGADLTEFKLMGNDIKLHQRTESVWLVLAALNAYFWFRFVQHIPSGSFRFDRPMNHLYDRALITAAIWTKHFELKRCVERVRVPNEEVKFNRGYAELTCYDRLKQDRREQPESEIQLHDYSRAKRTEIKVSGHYRYTDGGAWVRSGHYVRLEAYVPSAPVTWTVKVYSTIKGAFVTPWFTDHIAPLVFGLISTGFALWKWCDMNFFTTTLHHLAQSCAGLTH